MTDPSRETSVSSRYARHVTLPVCGVVGQEKLSRARVLLVGAGGLGCPVALYLAGAGVGHLTLIDDDRVDLSNLHRQIAFTESDVGRPKAAALAARCAALNSGLDVRPLTLRLHAAAARELLAGDGPRFDLVIDASDNPATRYLVSDSCHLARMPHLFGAVNRTYGQVALFSPASGRCVRSLFGDEPPYDAFPSCDEVGVLGPVPGLVGTAMATEALHWLIAGATRLEGRLLHVEAWDWETHVLAMPSPIHGAAALEARVREALTDRLDSETTWEDTLAATVSPPHALWVDVREPHEISAVPFPCVVLRPFAVPLSTWDIGTVRAVEHERLARDVREVVCVCRSGQRSLEAARRLRAGGVPARSVVGGLRAFPFP